MVTPKGFKKITYVTGLILATSLVGCSNGPEEGDESSTAKMESGYSYSSMSSKILVSEATAEQISPYKTSAPVSQKAKDKKKKQIWIQICHVPPGNPANEHDLVLPVSAIKAHLGHGDYLGHCGDHHEEEPTTGGEEVSSGGETPTTGGEEVSSGGETPTTGGEEVASGEQPTDGESTSGGEEFPGESTGSGETTTGGEEFPVGSTGGETSEPVVPVFCEPYYDIDRDCDGINDTTELPYL